MYMNFPKLLHSAMFVGATNVGKTEYLLRILGTEYNNNFEFIVIMCPIIIQHIFPGSGFSMIRMFLLCVCGRKIKRMDQII